MLGSHRLFLTPVRFRAWLSPPPAATDFAKHGTEMHYVGYWVYAGLSPPRLPARRPPQAPPWYVEFMLICFQNMLGLC